MRDRGSYQNEAAHPVSGARSRVLGLAATATARAGEGPRLRKCDDAEQAPSPLRSKWRDKASRRRRARRQGCESSKRQRPDGRSAHAAVYSSG